MPYLGGVLPAGVQGALQLTPGHEIGQLLLMGDILHFAAIAWLILQLMYMLKNYWFWSTALAIVIIFLGPLLYDTSEHYVLQLFTGQPPRVFFPVLPWLVYPLMGMTIGYGLQRNAPDTFEVCKRIGMLCALIGAVLLYVHPTMADAGFYRTYPAETLLHVAVTLLSLWGWHKLTPRIRQRQFFDLLQFSSRHITVIYLIQWVLIGWLLPLVGYQTMNLVESVIMSVYVSVITFTLTYFMVNRKVL